MKKKEKTSYIFYFLMIVYMLFLLPEFIRHINPAFGTLSQILRGGGTLIAILVFFFIKRKSKTLIFIIIYSAYLLLITLLKGNGAPGVVRWIAIYSDIIGISILTEYLLKKKPEKYIECMYFIGTLGLVLNVITVFFFPDGIIQVPNEDRVLFPYYFYDYDNYFIIRYLPHILISQIEFASTRKKRIDVTFIIIICLVSTLLVNSVASSFALIVLLICYLCIKILNEKIFNAKTGWIAYISISVLILIFCTNDNLVNFIAATGKTVSMNKRLYMWNITPEVLRENMLFGLGIKDTTSMRMIFRYATLHNTMFNTLIWGGFVGLILFSMIILSAYSNITISNMIVRRSSYLTLMAFLVASLVDSNELQPCIYIMFIVSANLGYFENIRIRRKRLVIRAK